MSAALAAPARPPRGAKFGLSWSAGAQVAGTVMRLGSTLVLTRLLAPEAYALLGTAMVVLTTLEWLADMGVTPALVRHPDGERAEWLLTGWWLTLGRGAVLALATAALAFPLAAFYDQPALGWVVLALAARPLVVALRSPAVPVLRRRLEYRALFLDEVAQTATGVVVGIAVASAAPGRGVWALVAGTLAGAVVGVVMSYALAPMAPRLCWDRAAARQLVGFGGAVFVNTLLMAAWLNLDKLAGPRVLPLTAVGLYAVAWNLAAAAEAVVTRGTDVYLALLARREPASRAEWHAATAGRVVAVAGPVVALGIAVAPAAVRVLYDPRYHAAGLLLAVLLGRLLLRLAGQLDFQVLLAAGHIRTASLGYAAGGAAAAALVPLVSALGVLGLAAGALLSTAVVSAVPALLAEDLDRGAIRRLAVAAGWAAAGIVGAVALDGVWAN